MEKFSPPEPVNPFRDLVDDDFIHHTPSKVKFDNDDENENKEGNHPFIYEYPSQIEKVIKEGEVNIEEPVDVEVIFSFDTTGSMSPVIKNVRNNLTETIDRLFNEVKGLRIGLIAHGDYCDYRPNKVNSPVMWKLNPTNNINQLKEFIKNNGLQRPAPG